MELLQVGYLTGRLEPVYRHTQPVIVPLLQYLTGRLEPVCRHTVAIELSYHSSSVGSQKYSTTLFLLGGVMSGGSAAIGESSLKWAEPVPFLVLGATTLYMVLNRRNPCHTEYTGHAHVSP